MNAGERMVVARGCALRKPKYRAAYLQEFNVPAREPGWDWYCIGLWVEALCDSLARSWRRHGRAGW